MMTFGTVEATRYAVSETDSIPVGKVTEHFVS